MKFIDNKKARQRNKVTVFKFLHFGRRKERKKEKKERKEEGTKRKKERQ